MAKYNFIEMSIGEYGMWRTADGFECYTDNMATAVRWYKRHLERKRMAKTCADICSARKNDSAKYIHVQHLLVHQDELQEIPCRWLNEGTEKEQFQIFYKKMWLNAQSIDFEFNH